MKNIVEVLNYFRPLPQSSKELLETYITNGLNNLHEDDKRGVTNIHNTLFSRLELLEGRDELQANKKLMRYIRNKFLPRLINQEEDSSEKITKVKILLVLFKDENDKLTTTFRRNPVVEEYIISEVLPTELYKLGGENRVKSLKFLVDLLRGRHGDFGSFTENRLKKMRHTEVSLLLSPKISQVTQQNNTPKPKSVRFYSEVDLYVSRPNSVKVKYSDYKDLSKDKAKKPILKPKQSEEEPVGILVDPQYKQKNSQQTTKSVKFSKESLVTYDKELLSDKGKKPSSKPRKSSKGTNSLVVDGKGRD